jgi:hypothetical protein
MVPRYGGVDNSRRGSIPIMGALRQMFEGAYPLWIQPRRKLLVGSIVLTTATIPKNSNGVKDRNLQKSTSVHRDNLLLALATRIVHCGVGYVRRMAAYWYIHGHMGSNKPLLLWRRRGLLSGDSRIVVLSFSFKPSTCASNLTTPEDHEKISGSRIDRIVDSRSSRETYYLASVTSRVTFNKTTHA